jgi:hypothetical protein
MLGDGVGDGGSIDRDGLESATKDEAVGRALSVVWASACPGSGASGIRSLRHVESSLRLKDMTQANHIHIMKTTTTAMAIMIPKIIEKITKLVITKY